MLIIFSLYLPNFKRCYLRHPTVYLKMRFVRQFVIGNDLIMVNIHFAFSGCFLNPSFPKLLPLIFP